MGQKVSPRGFRLVCTKDWDSKWYSDKSCHQWLGEDAAIRKVLSDKLKESGVARVEVERTGPRIGVIIYTARPGMVIGKKGRDIDSLKVALRAIVSRDVGVKVVEVRRPDRDAVLVARSIAQQLERRVNFRRAMKDAVNKAMRAGAEGVKVIVSGRLNGADIARPESVKEGRVPLHTLRANVEYSTAEALTTYGIIGIKVWIFNGLSYSGRRKSEVANAGVELA